MSCPSAPNCSIPDDWIIPFDADPDIAGIGVLLGFVIPAVFTYLLVFFAYLFVDGSLPEDDLTRLDRRLIEFRRRILKSIARFLRPGGAARRGENASSSLTKDAIQEILVMFSDQQLVTSSSILVTAYARHCFITQYHFYIAWALAELSFTTHQSCTIFLGGYFLQDRFEGSGLTMRLWRFLWISATFFMMSVALVLVMADSFFETYGLPTQCAWENTVGQYSTENLAELVLFTALNFWGYLCIARVMLPLPRALNQWISDVSERFELLALKLLMLPTRAVLACSTRLEAARDSLRNISGQQVEAFSEIPRLVIRLLIWSLLWPVSSLLFLICLTLREIFSSMLIDLLRIFGLVLLGVRQVFMYRPGATDGGMSGSEDTWGFGQILPLLLFALPAFATLEIVTKKRTSRDRAEPKSRRMQALKSAYPSRSTASKLGSSMITDFAAGTCDNDVDDSNRDSAETMRGFTRTASGASEVPQPAGSLRSRRSFPKHAGGSGGGGRGDSESAFGDTMVPMPPLEDEPDPGQRTNCSRSRKTWAATDAENAKAIRFEDEVLESQLFFLWVWLVVSGSFVGIVFGAQWGIML